MHILEPVSLLSHTQPLVRASLWPLNDYLYKIHSEANLSALPFMSDVLNFDHFVIVAIMTLVFIELTATISSNESIL